MYSFVVTAKPKSYNSWGSTSAVKKERYKLLFSDSFKKNYASHIPVDIEMYGLVYHFFRPDIGIDADNLSKPIWDCLTEVIYQDDKQIKMRIAGSFDLTINDPTVFDLSGLPGTVIDSLLDAFDNEDHVIYVECGSFTTNMIKLNLEEDGN